MPDAILASPIDFPNAHRSRQAPKLIHVANKIMIFVPLSVTAASRSHTMIGVDEEGSLDAHFSSGNSDTFAILRGGSQGTNFSPKHIQHAEKELLHGGLQPRIVVDCSHGNSMKDYRNQSKVAGCIADQVAAGATISGVMVESNINEGE